MVKPNRYLTVIYLRYIVRLWLNGKLLSIATLVSDANTNGYRETQRMSLVCVQSAKVLTGINREAGRVRSNRSRFPEGEVIAVLPLVT